MESGFTEQHGRREQRLVGCRSYFDHVLTPNANSFFNEPRTFSSTINLATSLFHFHEWLHREFEVELMTRFGDNAAKPSGFWQCVEAVDPLFGYVRDVTNASKHVNIGTAGPKPSTGIRTIESVMIVNRGYGMGGYGGGSYGGALTQKYLTATRLLISMNVPKNCFHIGPTFYVSSKAIQADARQFSSLSQLSKADRPQFLFGSLVSSFMLAGAS
ncbi:hypothetical protein [Pannonibacter tanglangensis]|uniref:Uncharacterized protein n=1 Tax=Pannonibacter tanglangensis TaxID=2750084 RepID=A0ABW9ZIF3_9HYPH|nr:hypothetical protein [Pannonibacter sp. XCT-34]NBN63823.1 hypothetical protein [Pannonibacter sp. XCT-34]